jgi:hypothetical protein
MHVPVISLHWEESLQHFDKNLYPQISLVHSLSGWNLFKHIKKIPVFSSVIFKISNEAGGFLFILFFLAGQDNALLNG